MGTVQWHRPDGFQSERFTFDVRCMRLALRLARRAYGQTSPNPMVGAVLVQRGKIIGQGWHRRAGEPHAEIEALQAADRRGARIAGATLYVTLEPCCTWGRTPPCTDAIRAAGLARVVVGAADPNPAHAGKGLRRLECAGIEVTAGVLAGEAAELNEAFNHWIAHGTPFVTVKAAMTLDGKIATAGGESKWITGNQARAHGLRLRRGADAILVGVNTILRDDPSLTPRGPRGSAAPVQKPWRRIILDSQGRTPLTSQVLRDAQASQTTIVVTRAAPERARKALAERAQVWVAPAKAGQVDLRRLLAALGRERVTHLLVEGGGEVNARFLLGGFAHRIAFFYAPKVIGGRAAIKAVAGGASLPGGLRLREVQWRRLGPDLLLKARVENRPVG